MIIYARVFAMIIYARVYAMIIPTYVNVIQISVYICIRIYIYIYTYIVTLHLRITHPHVHIPYHTHIPYTLRSKGAKWHPLGFFGLSLYWHPQKVLQRTLLGGSLERTLLRTLIWGSLKEPCRVRLNHKLGAAKNHLGVLYSTMWY